MFQPVTVQRSYETPESTPSPAADPRPLSSREQMPQCPGNNLPLAQPEIAQGHGQAGIKHHLQVSEPSPAKRSRLDGDEATPLQPAGTSACPTCKKAWTKSGKRGLGGGQKGSRKKNDVSSEHEQQPAELSWLPPSLWCTFQRKMTLEDLENAWDLCFALRSQPALIYITRNASLEDLWSVYQKYEQMEENVNATKILSRMGRWVYLVWFYRTYKRKQREAGEVPGKPSTVKAEFITKMFPKGQKRQKHAKKDSKDLVSAFNHQMHVARRLSDLVSHFGCGVLLYPGFDMSISA